MPVGAGGRTGPGPGAISNNMPPRAPRYRPLQRAQRGNLVGAEEIGSDRDLVADGIADVVGLVQQPARRKKKQSAYDDQTTDKKPTVAGSAGFNDLLRVFVLLLGVGGHR